MTTAKTPTIEGPLKAAFMAGWDLSAEGCNSEYYDKPDGWIEEQFRLYQASQKGADETAFKNDLLLYGQAFTDGDGKHVPLKDIYYTAPEANRVSGADALKALDKFVCAFKLHAGIKPEFEWAQSSFGQWEATIRSRLADQKEG